MVACLITRRPQQGPETIIHIDHKRTTGVLMNDSKKKQRTVMMSDADWQDLKKTAAASGMSCSAFMVACALHDEPAGVELMSAPDERKALLDHLRGRQPVSQAAVWADRVVMAPPGFDENLGFLESAEEFAVQEFVA